MKQLCLFLAILMMPSFGFSQFIGDTVTLYVNNRVEIKIATSDYTNLTSSNGAKTALDQFQGLLPEFEDRVSPVTADLVTYDVDHSLSVQKGDSQFIYLIKEGKATDTGLRDKAIINGEGFQIFLITSDITQILELPLSSCLQKAISLLPKKSNWAKSLYFECINDEVKEISDQNTTAAYDFLELNAGVGANLIRDTWIPDLSLKIGLGFNRKGALHYNPYLSSNVIFDFNAEGSIKANTFLNLGYSWNLDKTSKKPDLLGFEVGYLISQKGDLFQGNTFKLGMNWSPAKAISVNPHLYFSDNFNKVFPGIRIGFGF